MAVKKQTDNSGLAAAPPPGKRIKRGLIGLACVAVLAAAYGGYWSFLAGQVQDGIDRWAAERRAEGYGVEYAAVKVFGFPFRLEAVIVDPVLTAPGEHGLRSWHGPIMIMQARPWALSKVRVLAFGRHRVTVMTGDKRKTLDIEFGSLIAALNFNPSGASFAVTLEASDIAYPSAPVTGLGRMTKRLILSVAVKGDLPARRNAETMARWRDSGGTLDVQSLDIRHGPLKVSGDGTLALDGDMQPIGSFALRVEGFIEALDRLSEAGVIKPRQAALASVVLGALARDAGSGGDARIKVPLSIQERQVFVGPVPLARMPVFRW
jgi:hypothetical protein